MTIKRIKVERNIMTGTGMPKTRWFPIAIKAGSWTNTDFPPEMIYARPRKIDMDASVAINGSNLRKFTKHELKKPINNPKAVTISRATTTGIPLVSKIATKTPENAATDPGDKST